MNTTAAIRPLLLLLVRVYNQSVQCYYHFPDVIICGKHRIEKEEFEFLLEEGFVICYHTDSFGKLFHLSKKGEAFLRQALLRRRAKRQASFAGRQNNFLF